VLSEVDGTRIQGTWNNGDLDGEVNLKDTHGMAVAHFVHGQPEGPTDITYGDGSKASGKFIHGQLEGIWRLNFADSTRRELSRFGPCRNPLR
jgi:hypothetical protein